MKSVLSLSLLSLRFAKKHIRYLVLQLFTLSLVMFGLLVSGGLANSISSAVDRFAAGVSEGTNIVVIDPSGGSLADHHLDELSALNGVKTVLPTWWTDAFLGGEKTLLIASAQLGEPIKNTDLEIIKTYDASLILGPSAPVVGDDHSNLSVDGYFLKIDRNATERLPASSSNLQRINGGNFIIAKESTLRDLGVVPDPKVLFLSTSEHASVDDVLSEVKSVLPAKTTVVPVSEYARILGASTTLVVSVADMLAFAMLITGIFIIASISWLSLETRRYDLSLVRLLGVSRPKLVAWNVLESLALMIPSLIVSISLCLVVCPTLIRNLPDALYGELPIRPTGEISTTVIFSLCLVAGVILATTRAILMLAFLRNVDKGLIYLRSTITSRASNMRSLILTAAGCVIGGFGITRDEVTLRYSLAALAILVFVQPIVQAFSALFKLVFSRTCGMRATAGYTAACVFKNCASLVVMSAVALSVPFAAYTAADNLIERGNTLVSSLREPSFYIQTSDASSLPMRTLLTEDDLASVKSFQGVTKVVPGLLKKINVNGGEMTMQGVSDGTSMPAAINAGEDAVQQLLKTDNGIILNRKAATFLGAHAGDTVSLPLPGLEDAVVLAIDDYISADEGQIVLSSEALCKAGIECNFSYFEVHTKDSGGTEKLEEFVASKNRGGQRSLYLSSSEDVYQALSMSIGASAYLVFMLSLALFFSCIVAIYVLYTVTLKRVLPMLNHLASLGYPERGVSLTAFAIVSYVALVSALIGAALAGLFTNLLSGRLASSLALEADGLSIDWIELSMFFPISAALLLAWGCLAAYRTLRKGRG